MKKLLLILSLLCIFSLTGYGAENKVLLLILHVLIILKK